MPTQHNFPKSPVIEFAKYKYLRSQANAALERDKVQNSHPHEPTSRTSLTDPISGKDINKTDSDLPVADGNLTVYFATHATRKLFDNLPLNHPSLRVPFPASNEDERDS